MQRLRLSQKRPSPICPTPFANTFVNVGNGALPVSTRDVLLAPSPAGLQTNPDDYSYEHDPFESYRHLDSDDLSKEISRIKSQFHLIGSPSSQCLLSYMKTLLVVAAADSSVFPVSFTASLQQLTDAKRNEDMIQREVMLFKCYSVFDSLLHDVRCILHDAEKQYSQLLLTEITLNWSSLSAIQDSCNSRCITEILARCNLPSLNPSSVRNQLDRVNDVYHAIYEVVETSHKGMAFYKTSSSLSRIRTSSSLFATRAKAFKDNAAAVEKLTVLFFIQFLLLLKALMVWFKGVVVSPVSNCIAYVEYLRMVFRGILDRLSCVDALRLGESEREEIMQGVVRIQALMMECCQKAEEQSPTKWNPGQSTMCLRLDTIPFRYAYKPVSSPRLGSLKNIPVVFTRCNRVEDRFLFMTVGGDGVAVTRSSTLCNTWYCFTFNLISLPYSFEYLGKDIVFSFIIPENPSSPLYCASEQEEEEKEKETMTKEEKEFAKVAFNSTMQRATIVDEYYRAYAMGNMSRSNCLTAVSIALQRAFEDYLKAPPNLLYRRMKRGVYRKDCVVEDCDPDLLPREGDKRKKAVTASNSYSRQLCHIILKETLSEGNRGYLFAYGDTLLHIRFAVFGARADLPAADDLLDSAGLCVSNNPCRMCDLGYCYFDPNTLLSPAGLNLSLFSGREHMKGLFSSLSREKMSSVYRLMNHIFFLLRNAECHSATVHDILLNEMKKRHLLLTDDDRYIRDLDRLIEYVSLIPTSSLPYRPSSTLFFPEYTTSEECKKPTCAYYSNGEVNLPLVLGFPASCCCCVDMMHTVSNALKCFMALVFGGDETNRGKGFMESYSYVKQSLTKAKLLDASSVGCWFLPPTVLQCMKETLDRIGLRNNNPVRDALQDGSSLLNAKTHVHHVIAFCYLPCLLLEVNNHPIVRAFVSVFVLCHRLYNSSSRREVLLCQRKVDLLMNVVNGFGAPFTENPSFHYLTHLLLCVKYFGQLRLMDCFPLEGAFSYLRQFFVATSNSTVTSFKKEMEKTVTSLVVTTTTKTITTSTEIGEETEVVICIKRVDETEVMWRSLFNYSADVGWLKCGLFAQITLWDIEKCNSVKWFLESVSSVGVMDKAFVMKEARCPNVLQGTIMTTYTPLESLKKLGECVGMKPMKRGQYGRRGLFHECCCNGTCLSSLQVPLRELTPDVLVKNHKALCLVVDYFHYPHLYVMIGFVPTRFGEADYVEFWGYEIPTLSMVVDDETMCCRIVDFDSPRMRDTPHLELISVRRCVGDLVVFRYRGNAVGVICEKTSISQFNQYIPI